MQVTGFYFHKNYVIYSTKTKEGRFCSMHNREGLTDQQAMGKFHLEHAREVEHLVRIKKEGEEQHKIIIN